MDENRPIGIFDSGIGGLTVFQAVRRHLPHEDLLYLGDTARVPYGTKSAETVYRFSQEAVRFLLAKEVKLLIVACNTASALALERLQGECPVPLLGVVAPGVRGAVKKSRNHKIGVIGTEGTIRSGSYAHLIRHLSPQADVTSIACPLFVPIVEEGWLDHPATRLVAQHYLAPFSKKEIDTLILGCTHYPLLKPVIQEILPSIQLVDSAEEVATEASQMLQEKDLLARRPGGSPRFFVTDTPDRFRRVGEIFLGTPLSHVEHVKI